MTSVQLDRGKLTKISESYPIALIDMDISPDLYYSTHGVLHDGENGLDRWYKFEGNTREVFKEYQDIYVFNPNGSTGTLEFRYEEFPSIINDCSTVCNNEVFKHIVQVYP